MRHGQLDCRRKVDDRLPVCGRFPDIQHSVADLQRVFRLCAGERFRAVLKTILLARLFCQLCQQFRSFDRDLFDLLFGLLEHLLSLRKRGGIVHMDNGIAAAFQSLKGLADDMLSCLCQNLERNILRYHIALDQGAQELIFRLGCRGESDLDLLEADLHQ